MWTADLKVGCTFLHFCFRFSTLMLTNGTPLNSSYCRLNPVTKSVRACLCRTFIGVLAAFIPTFLHCCLLLCKAPIQLLCIRGTRVAFIYQYSECLATKPWPSGNQFGAHALTEVVQFILDLCVISNSEVYTYVALFLLLYFSKQDNVLAP